MKAAGIIVGICLLGALGVITWFTGAAYAREPDCPSSWPDEPTEQFFTDSAGGEWFVIRSVDSNGYGTVRAYRADDRYQSGYEPGSPDEVCYLLVRRPGSAEDLAEAKQQTFRAEREPQQQTPTTAVSKTLFRELYDRLIPAGPYGPNPDPNWGDLSAVFSTEERSCMIAALGEEGLEVALQGSVFREGEPRLQDVVILSCLSDDTATALVFAMALANIVRQVAASGEENPCIQELLEPAVAALSNPHATEEELWSVIALFFGLSVCGLEATSPSPGLPGG